MKIIFDKETKIDSIVLENYKFTPADMVHVKDFCQEAFSTPETIGGIYWQDMKGVNHSMETTNQTLYCLLFTFYYLSRHQAVNIKYDTDRISVDLLGGLFNRPKWLIKLGQKLGLISKTVTYTDFIQVIRERERSKQTEAVPRQVSK